MQERERASSYVKSPSTLELCIYQTTNAMVVEKESINELQHFSSSTAVTRLSSRYHKFCSLSCLKMQAELTTSTCCLVTPFLFLFTLSLCLCTVSKLAIYSTSTSWYKPLPMLIRNRWFEVEGSRVVALKCTNSSARSQGTKRSPTETVVIETMHCWSSESFPFSLQIATFVANSRDRLVLLASFISSLLKIHLRAEKWQGYSLRTKNKDD